MIIFKAKWADFSDDQLQAGLAAFARMRLPVEAAAAALPWCVVRTAHRKEARVVQDLAKAQWQTYLPLRATWEGRARRKHRSERPLLPGYVFAAAVPGADVAAPASIDGVVAVRRHCEGRRTIVTPWQMLRLMVADAAGAFDETIEKPQLPKHTLEIGQAIMMTAGPFQGFGGRIEKILSNRNVVASILLFGRATETTVDASWVRAVEEAA